MPLKLLSAEDFRAAAKGGAHPEGIVARFSEGTLVKADTGAARTLRYCFSDGSVDLAGDTIDPKGWDLSSFAEDKNPVALWAHMSWEPPIGKARNVGVIGEKLIGDIEFAAAELYAFADTIYRLAKEKFINAVSVGFMPIEWTFVNEKDRPFGIDFKKQKLLEISVCPVPCNGNALAEARSAGIDTRPVEEWAARVLDTGAKVLVPRDVLEETFRQAKTPRAVRQKYLAKAESSEWKAGAPRDLPLDDSDAWDGPAAAKRMLDDAGFDGESPDAAKAARGFLIHDAANPALRGSYKLPFADIVGGALKAVKGGIRAAASRLPQTDAPAAVLDEARAVVDAYEKRFSEDKAADGDGPMPGNCGRAKDEECGMKNPMECCVHAPPVESNTAAPAQKAGRRISSANAALLQEAMDHHASATKCIKDVLASNESDGADDPDNNDGNNIEIPLTDEAKRAKRLREARELIAPVKH